MFSPINGRLVPYILDGGWSCLSQDLHSRRPVQSSEVTIWNGVKSTLPTPSFADDNDLPIWKLNTQGTFNTTSLKSAIHTSDSNGPILFYPDTFRNLWKSSITKKCKFFIWSLIHDWINTADNLQKRLPSMQLRPNWCVMCRKNEENKDHLFLHCSYAATIWKKFKFAAQLELHTH